MSLIWRIKENLEIKSFIKLPRKEVEDPLLELGKQTIDPNKLKTGTLSRILAPLSSLETHKEYQLASSPTRVCLLEVNYFLFGSELNSVLSKQY